MIYYLFQIRRMIEGEQSQLSNETYIYLETRLNRSAPVDVPYLGLTFTRKRAKQQNERIISESENEKWIISPSPKSGNDKLMLVVGGPVQITENIYKNKKLILYNGQFGIFEGWENDVDYTECIKKGKMYKVVKISKKLVAKVRFGDTVHCVQATKHKDSKGVSLPIMCAFYTTIHRVQVNALAHFFFVENIRIFTG